MVQTVAQPIFVELKDNGDRQLAALRKLMRVTAFISFPMLFGFGLVAHEFIVITITDIFTYSISSNRVNQRLTRAKAT